MALLKANNVINNDINRSVKSLTKNSTNLIDLDLENLKLEQEYNDNWSNHEGFNLEEAFKLQNIKIETEYKVFEKSLTSKLGSIADTSGVDPRWHHPEKQRRLVHTAPVMSPSRPAANTSIRNQHDLSSRSYVDDVNIIYIIIHIIVMTYVNEIRLMR
jgi:hypothetical protein